MTSVETNLGAGAGDNEGLLWNIKQEDTDDELSIFAGHTRFIAGKTSWNYDKDHSLYGPPSAPLSAKKTAAPPSSSRHAGFEPTPQLHVPRVPTPPGSALRSGWTSPEQDHGNARQKMDISSLSPVDNMRYPYVPSERTHQMHISPSSPSPSSYTWSTQPSYRHQGIPPPVSQSDANRYLDPNAVPAHIQPQRSLAAATLPPQQHPEYFHHQLQPPQHSSQPPQPYQHQTQYETTPPFPVPPQGAAGALADLGLSSRDSRLDARWSSFMEDSGLLDSFEGQ